MNQKQKVYNLASTLLEYPEEEWKDVEEVMEEVSTFSPEAIRKPLMNFLSYLNTTSYEELCENYVYTFDFYEKASLHLTHSVFKDNRERGPVLVQLRQEFYKAGIEFTSEELPDYLPLILEFAAIVPEEHSHKILQLHLRSIRNLQLELQGINSPYRHLLTACIRCIEQATENEKVS